MGAADSRFYACESKLDELYDPVLSKHNNKIKNVADFTLEIKS